MAVVGDNLGDVKFSLGINLEEFDRNYNQFAKTFEGLKNKLGEGDKSLTKFEGGMSQFFNTLGKTEQQINKVRVATEKEVKELKNFDNAVGVTGNKLKKTSSYLNTLSKELEDSKEVSTQLIVKTNSLSKSYERMSKTMGKVGAKTHANSLKKLGDRLKKINAEYKKGKITSAQYTKKLKNITTASDKLKPKIDNATKSTKKNTASLKKWETQINASGEAMKGLITKLNKYQKEADETVKKNKKMTRTFEGMKGGALAMIGPYGAMATGIAAVGYAAVSGITSAFRLGEEYKINARSLKALTEQTGDYNEVSAKLYKISNNSGVAVRDITNSFKGLKLATGGLNISNEELIATLQGVTSTAIKFGERADDVAGAMRQINQSVVKNRVEMDEWRIIQERAPILIQKMAETVGMTASQLSAQVNTDVGISGKYLFELLSNLKDQSEVVLNTFGAATNRLQNALSSLFSDVFTDSEAFEEVSGFIDSITKALIENKPAIKEFLSDTAKSVINLIKFTKQLALLLADVAKYSGLTFISKGFFKLIGALSNRLEKLDNIDEFKKDYSKSYKLGGLYSATTKIGEGRSGGKNVGSGGGELELRDNIKKRLEELIPRLFGTNELKGFVLKGRSVDIGNQQDLDNVREYLKRLFNIFDLGDLSKLASESEGKRVEKELKESQQQGAGAGAGGGGLSVSVGGGKEKDKSKDALNTANELVRLFEEFKGVDERDLDQKKVDSMVDKINDTWDDLKEFEKPDMKLFGKELINKLKEITPDSLADVEMGKRIGIDISEGKKEEEKQYQDDIKKLETDAKQIADLFDKLQFADVMTLNDDQLDKMTNNLKDRFEDFQKFVEDKGLDIKFDLDDNKLKERISGVTDKSIQEEEARNREQLDAMKENEERIKKLNEAINPFYEKMESLDKSIDLDIDGLKDLEGLDIFDENFDDNMKGIKDFLDSIEFKYPELYAKMNEEVIELEEQKLNRIAELREEFLTNQIEKDREYAEKEEEAFFNKLKRLQEAYDRHVKSMSDYEGLSLKGRNQLIEEEKKKREELEQAGGTGLKNDEEAKELINKKMRKNLAYEVAGITSVAKAKENAGQDAVKNMRTVEQAVAESGRKGFQAMKALNIARAVINMHSSMLGGYKYGVDIGGPALGGVMMALAGASSLIQLNAIRKTQYQGGRRLGGNVSKHSMYEVGEGGMPELLDMGGRSMLLTGGQSGRVRPASKGGGVMMGTNVNVNVYPIEGTTASIQESQDENNTSIDIFIEKIESSMAQKIAGGEGILNNTLESSYNLQRNA